MKVIKKGRYIGRYKQDDMWYYHFKPEVINTKGKLKYVRIGNYKEEFANNRTYILHLINDEEQKLVNENKYESI